MTNQVFIAAFVNGRGDSRNGSLSISENRLFSYDAVIGTRMSDGRIVVGAARYSPTTNRHISILMTSLMREGYVANSVDETTTTDQYGRIIPQSLFTYERNTQN